MGELEALRHVDFNWVVHPDLVWDEELPDAPGLHGRHWGACCLVPRAREKHTFKPCSVGGLLAKA
jgi:hypothetical protein